MCFSFLKQIEQSLKELSDENQTMQSSLGREMKEQRLILQELVELVQGQRAEFARDLQQLLSTTTTPARSKNLSELHTLDLQKANKAKSTIVDYGSNHQIVAQSFKVADQERKEAQEDLGSAIENVFFSSAQNTDEIPKLEKQKEDNPPEFA